MKTDVKIYTPEELEMIQFIETGNYKSVPKNEFASEKKHFSTNGNEYAEKKIYSN